MSTKRMPPIQGTLEEKMHRILLGEKMSEIYVSTLSAACVAADEMTIPVDEMIRHIRVAREGINAKRQL